MKAPQETGLVVGVLLSAAVSAGAQPVGALAVDERQGDLYYEPAGVAGQRALETNTAPGRVSRSAPGTSNCLPKSWPTAISCGRNGSSPTASPSPPSRR